MYYHSTQPTFLPQTARTGLAQEKADSWHEFGCCNAKTSTPHRSSSHARRERCRAGSTWGRAGCAWWQSAQQWWRSTLLDVFLLFLLLLDFFFFALLAMTSSTLSQVRQEWVPFQIKKYRSTSSPSGGQQSWKKKGESCSLAVWAQMPKLWQNALLLGQVLWLGLGSCIFWSSTSFWTLLCSGSSRQCARKNLFFRCWALTKWPSLTSVFNVLEAGTRLPPSLIRVPRRALHSTRVVGFDWQRGFKLINP